MMWRQLGKLTNNWWVQDFENLSGQSVAVLHNGSAACFVTNSDGHYLIEKDLDEDHTDISITPFVMINHARKVTFLEQHKLVFDSVVLESILNSIMEASSMENSN